MKRTLSLTTLLAAGLALLAFAVLAHDLAAPQQTAPAPDDATAAPPPTATTAATPPATLANPAIYADIAARPLFFPTRRPPPAAAGAAAPTTPPLNFTLIGVVTGPSQTEALVQQPGQAAAVLVHVGSVVDGWTVTRIGRSGIEVRANGTSSALRIMQ